MGEAIALELSPQVRVDPQTFADPGLLVELKASRTVALEAAEGVDAVAAVAQARQLIALVDICQTHVTHQILARCITDAERTPTLPSRMTVMGLGRKPSPPGHRVLYSAGIERTPQCDKTQITMFSNSFHSLAGNLFVI